MDDGERLKLLHGPYVPPRCRRGDTLRCEYRDRDVKVGGMTDTPIQWPRALKTGKASPIVCGDLVRAIRTESEIAVAHHWGVCVVTVWAWRKALGVPQITEGTGRLYRDYKPEKLTEEASAAGRAAAMAPDILEHQRRIRAGKPAHPATRAALLEASKRPKSEAWKAKAREWLMAADRRLPSHLRTWTSEEDSAIGTANDREIAQRLNRTIPAVRQRRAALGIPAYTPKETR